MNKKEIKNKVYELLAIGKTKSEVFSQISGQGANEKQLAFIIASYANPDRCNKQRTNVNILITIMAIEALLAFVVGFGVGAQIGPNARWVVAILCLCIPAFFAWGFHANRVGAYTGYILLSLIQLPKTLAGLASNPNPTATFIMIAINLCILSYVWYVRGKIFPDFAFTGPKKINGQYVFSAG